MTCMRARTSSKFGMIGLPTAELSALECLKKSIKAYNGKMDVSFLYLQVMMTCIRARKSSNFGLIGPPTVELAAFERLKKIPIGL